MHTHSRQGDLLLLHQESPPAGELTARQGNVIVAGEATGHAHRLQAGTILEASDGTRSLDSTQTTQVLHEAHGPLTLDPGLWLVVRKPEYRPAAIRTVAE